jgi:hypothetical protein
MAVLHHDHPNGNGSGNGHVPLPLSKRAFTRSLPPRMQQLELEIDAHDRRAGDFVRRLTALEARSAEQDLAARVELVHEVVDLLCLALGKRRSRRQPAAARSA